MLVGILLGVSFSTLITSAVMIFGGYTGAVRENLITGAAIGTSSLISYSILAFFISLMASIFLIAILRKRLSKNRSFF